MERGQVTYIRYLKSFLQNQIDWEMNEFYHQPIKDFINCPRCLRPTSGTVRLKSRIKNTKRVHRVLKRKADGQKITGRYQRNLLNRCLQRSNSLEIKCRHCFWKSKQQGQNAEQRIVQQTEIAQAASDPQWSPTLSLVMLPPGLESKSRKKMKKKARKQAAKILTRSSRLPVEKQKTQRCDSLPFKDIPRCDSGSLPATYSLSGIPSLADISFEMPRNSLHMLHSFSLTSMMFQGEKSVHAIPKTEYSKKLHQSAKIKMSHLSQPPLFHQTDKTCRHKEGRKKKGKFHQQLHCMLNKERLEDSASKESLAQFLESLQ